MTAETTDAPTRRKVHIALVVAVFASTFAAIFFRETAPTHPFVAAGWRLALAAVLLAPALARAVGRGDVDGRILRAGCLAGLCYGLTPGLATVNEPAAASLPAWLRLDEFISARVAPGCALTAAAVILALRQPALSDPPAR